MPTFAREPPPKRTVLVAVRVTPAEAETIDALAKRLGVDGRSGVLRAGLDSLIANLPPLRTGGQAPARGSAPKSGSRSAPAKE
jgi:hypothetical protein